jgi:hypothetical protein
MAIRPVFKATSSGSTLVETVEVEFEWYAGLSVSQKRKSIASLHESACMTAGCSNVLEVSSRSMLPLGVGLSAFNLSFEGPDHRQMSVECAFQGSKVFEGGGPFSDLYRETSLNARRDVRLKNLGQLVGFSYFGQDWPLEPKTVFYDWLYVNALHRAIPLAKELKHFDGFTDIEFNPKKSYNCQAHSVALHQSLLNRGLLQDACRSQSNFMKIMTSQSKERTCDIVPTQSAFNF